jgi:SPFH/band 7/PHB domain protein
MWIVPSELSDALKGLGQVANSTDVRDYVSQASHRFSAPKPVDVHAEIAEQTRKDHEQSSATVEQAIADAQALDGGRATPTTPQPQQPARADQTPPQRQTPPPPPGGGNWPLGPGGIH